MATIPEPETQAAISRKGKGPELTEEKRMAIVQAILGSTKDDAVPRGFQKTIAARFGVHRATVRRIWTRATASKQGEKGAYCAKSKKGERGRKKKDFSQQLANLKNVPPSQRGTFRSTANAVGLNKSTLYNLVKRKEIRIHTSTLKPVLTDANKKQRVDFCTRLIDKQTMTFSSMMDVIHIDEKWFYISKNTRRIFLTPDEREPYRATKSKRFMTKVMFLCAVARPRWDSGRNQTFSGKIGIWPIVDMVPAQRSSRNRDAGTIVTKPIDVNAQVYCRFLVENLIPSIAAFWPRAYKGPIRVQQDNAKPHIKVDDAAFVEAVGRTGLDIRLECQPPNSPDLNVLDLGYFSSIQSLQQQKNATTVEELIDIVEDSFSELSYKKLDNIFLTLQCCMEKVLLDNGGNNYKIPHMSKRKLE
jgi:hypothetical protein